MLNPLKFFRKRMPARHIAPRAEKRRFRPAVEALEDRCLMSSTPTIQLEPVIPSGLVNPLLATNAGDGTNRLFVVEQRGVIHVLQPGSSTPSVFLNLSNIVRSGGEQGLLGLAFHPQYETNGRFFLHYTTNSAGSSNSPVNRIVEYQVDPADPNRALPNETLVLQFPAQPFGNHNGGSIEFGPDGFLYIAKGDGGSGDDPGNRAQTVAGNDDRSWFGKIHRIDIDGDDFPADPNRNYRIPASNPFAGDDPVTGGRDEIYAFGLRNPYRISFDRQTGELYVGDVGQNVREEINIVTLGGNYGWRAFEGSIPNPTSFGGPPQFPAEVAALQGIAIPPITEYSHPAPGGGRSVTGGYVYRGTQGALPVGSYLFADFITGEIFWYNGPPGSAPIQLRDEAFSISSFGEDEAGELYVVAYGNNGSVFRVIGINTNQPPVLAAIPDQTVPSSQDIVNVSLAASDPDGDPLTFTATAQGLAFVFDQQLGLTFTGDLFENYGGQGDRWLLGADGLWYFILPNGELYQWDGTPDQATGTLIINVGASYWSEIDLLYNAAEAAALDQQLGLMFTGDLFENYGGQGDRWLLGDGGFWYFILPNGELYRWDGTPDQATGELVAAPGPGFHGRIRFLYDGEAGQAPASLSIAGTELTIDRDDDFIGGVVVAVTVSDGQGGADSKTFNVIVNA